MFLSNQEYTVLKEKSLFRKLIFWGWLWDAEAKLSRILKHLKKGDTILDIGAGPCTICYLLEKNGFSPTPLDIHDGSMIETIPPRLYDGRKIPFENKSFDVALILTVLHHVSNQEKIIREAQRIAKTIIIIEDVYSNRFMKYLMFVADSLTNWEFKGHPHSNRTDQGWKDLFNQLNITLKHVEYKKILLLFKQAVYVLDTGGC
jgi:SAM-dependent methyltransferase